MDDAPVTEFITDREIYRRVILEMVPQARAFLWLATGVLLRAVVIGLVEVPVEGEEAFQVGLREVDHVDTTADQGECGKAWVVHPSGFDARHLRPLAQG